MCTPNAMSSTLIKETLVKLKNTHCTPDNISSTPLPHQWKVPGNKNKKEDTVKLTAVMKQIHELISIKMYSNTKGYPFFSAPHDAFSKIDHIISHKTCLNRYKNIEIILCIL